MPVQKKTTLNQILVPQTKLDLIVNIDMVREQIDVRSTTIYDLDYKKYIVVGQTNPPILKSMVGREIEASFLYRNKQSGQRRRIGFHCKILKYLTDYTIRPGVSDQAVVLSFPHGGLKETSVRLHYRVEPRSEDNISVVLPTVEGELHLLDLSLGGMLVSYRGRQEFKRGLVIPIDFTVESRQFRLKGEVVRAFERDGSKLIFLGVNFVEMNNDVQKCIQEMVGKIMREELRQRSGMTKPASDS